MNLLKHKPLHHDIETNLGLVSLQRANMYQMMAKAVQYPTLELAESLLNGKFLTEVAESTEWVNSRGGMYNAARLKLQEVAENQMMPQDLLEKMEEEYNRLFLPFGQEVLSPYERDYSKENKDSIILSLEKAYNGVTSDIPGNQSLSPDHIASELSYISYLGQQEGEAWLERNMEEAKRWKIKERTFIVHHLRKWGISFFVNLERSSEIEAYQAIASVGKVFMTLEHGN